MADVLFVVVTVAFFAAAGLLVGACDRLLGDEPAPPAVETGDPIEAAADRAAEPEAARR